jgi:hypothetical protein
VAWILRNERRHRYWSPAIPQGATLIHPERAHRFASRDEAEETAARLNGTAIHGGEVVYNDGWTVVEV